MCFFLVEFIYACGPRGGSLQILGLINVFNGNLAISVKIKAHTNPPLIEIYSSFYTSTCTKRMLFIVVKEQRWPKWISIGLINWFHRHILKGSNSKGWAEPWLVRLSGLSAGLRARGSSVRFLVRAHARVAVQVLSRGHVRGNHTLMFLSFSPSLPLSLKVNKLFKKKKVELRVQNQYFLKRSRVWWASMVSLKMKTANKTEKLHSHQTRRKTRVRYLHSQQLIDVERSNLRPERVEARLQRDVLWKQGLWATQWREVFLYCFLNPFSQFVFWLESSVHLK